MRIPFNDDWLFAFDIEKGFEQARTVRLPHTVKEIQYNYGDCSEYQTVCGYKKSFFADPEWSGKRLLLRFEGAAHCATVYCNGREMTHHACGYTEFTADITDAVIFGEENTVTVRLDTRESLNIPPFGFVIDYLCYGGLYREVTLEVREQTYISEVLIENTSLRGIRIRVNTVGDLSERTVITDILSTDGKSLASAIGTECEISVPDAQLWTTQSPVLYTARVRLIDSGRAVRDEKAVRFGFRTAVFRADGFYLNGEKLKLRGLNRHQSYPYVGYAMPESIQRLDAEILKNELGANAVRTSHYPQSRHFLDRCDELGLLVFTEIPGWQHIGDAQWKKQAIENTREMITQNMHHPSVILWGVRINESQDCDELYRETNRLAHSLDTSRQTSGVRYMEKSHLLEDVYAFNDFSHTGDNPGLKERSKVTPKMKKPYLISECNGHMFPTKAFDDERHRLEHALRHVNVLEAMYEADDICGLFSWCMADYNTHRDFGSGDGVCYHGVTDMFRNPKLAAAVYASQRDDVPCCEVSSSMDIGEHPAGHIGDVFVFTNADSVKLYKDGIFVSEFYPAHDKYPSLPHPPVIIDDLIGSMLETQEGYSAKTALTVKDCLKALAKFGVGALPAKYYAKFGYLMLTQGFKIADAYTLYGKYVGGWGGEATEWRFDAVKDGQVTRSVTRSSGQTVHLDIKLSGSVLHEGDTYDAAAVRIRAIDSFGNLAPYCQEPVTLRTEGCIELIGPSVISLKGGSGGTYVRSTGSGSGKLFVNGAEIEFTVT